MTRDQELARRLHTFRELQKLATPQGELEPRVVRDVGAYGGAQGIWVDKARTAALTSNGAGVAVGILHTGDSYPDDLAADCLIYHYPNTRRPSSRDAGEVLALKATRELQLPVFVITHAAESEDLRLVVLGWVEDWDDELKEFLIALGDESPSEPELPRPAEDETFQLHVPPTKVMREIAARTGQPRFKFRVFRRYGASCAACGITHPQLLDAAHLVSKKALGCDDPRNGLVLCSLHHRAFDAGLFAIDPATLEFRYRHSGPGPEELRITQRDLLSLRQRPHADALASCWRDWTPGASAGRS